MPTSTVARLITVSQRSYGLLCDLRLAHGLGGSGPLAGMLGRRGSGVNWLRDSDRSQAQLQVIARELANRYWGSPTFRTNSANRGSERGGSSKKSVFKPSSNES